MTDEKVRYEAKDGPKIFALVLLDKAIEIAFIALLVFFAYNCDWCGGPRMW